MAVVAVTCASQKSTELPQAPACLGSPVEREGIIYTPVHVGPQGCLLYRITIPGGQAPAALAYQSTDGQFSYGRPAQCVKKTDRSATPR